MPFDVVIAGGGFGGLYAARRLERRLPRHSARITVVSDVNFLLYTPLLPGAASGTLEPRHVVVPLREELEWAELLLGRVTGADPGVNELFVRTLDERDETLRYDQLIVAVGSVSRVAAGPGPRRARTRVQEPGRRRRAPKPRPAQPGDRRVAPGRQRPPRLPHLRVRRSGVRRRRGLRRAPGLRERHHRGLSALPRGGHALGAGRGAGPDHARDSGEPRGGRGERAQEARDGDPDRHDAREHGRAERRALDRRAPADPAGLLDRGRADARRGPAARAAAHEGRPDRDRRHDARQGLGQRLGDRRRGRGPGSGAAAQGGGAPDLPARHPRGPRGREQRRRGARGAEAAAVPLPHARRVRGPGPQQGASPPSSGCACAASSRGSRRGPTTSR